MKHCFWRINLYVICRSGCRSRCKRCTQTWSFLADWKRLMLQKGFSHGFWCTRDTWSFFVSNSVCFWNKGECFTLLSQSATFFSKQLSYLRPIFVNFSTEKHLYCQLSVAFETKTWKIKAERRRNHWRQKRVVFQKTFWTSPRKGIVFFLCMVNEISRKSLLIGQIGSSFFVEEMFRIQLFSLAFTEVQWMKLDPPIIIGGGHLTFPFDVIQKFETEICNIPPP